MEIQHSAGIIVFRKENTQSLYLLLHYASGHWDFPKGKLEIGETKEQAACRELQEETGIEQVALLPGFEHSLSYYFTSRDGRKIYKTVTFFVGKTDQRDVTLSHEHINFVWLPFEQAYQQLTYPNAQAILKEAHTFLSL